MDIFSICFKIKYDMCTNKNRLIEAILTSTHNIHFQNKVRALELSHIYLSAVNDLRTSSNKKAVVNELSVFEPLDFHCMVVYLYTVELQSLEH